MSPIELNQRLFGNSVTFWIIWTLSCPVWRGSVEILFVFKRIIKRLSLRLVFISRGYAIVCLGVSPLWDKPLDVSSFTWLWTNTLRQLNFGSLYHQSEFFHGTNVKHFNMFLSIKTYVEGDITNLKYNHLLCKGILLYVCFEIKASIHIKMNSNDYVERFVSAVKEC